MGKKRGEKGVVVGSSEEREWSEMPGEILEVVLQKLTSFEEQVRFGSVCKAWYPIAPDKPYLWTPEAPWLITNNYAASQFHLCRISDNKVFKIEKPFKPMAGSRIVGSLKGWLFIRTRRSDKLTILNLFSKWRLSLPSQRTLPFHLAFPFGYSAFGTSRPLAFSVSTSGCPSMNPTTIAMVTSGGGLAWCKPGDKAWRSHEGEQEFGNLLLHNGRLYAVDRDAEKVDIFEFEEDGKLLTQVATTGPCTPLLPGYDDDDDDELLDPADEPPAKVDAYMVECGGRVLVVRRYYLRKCIRPTNYFVVMEVDERCSPPKLKEAYSLGDHIVFVGDSSCESVPAEHCPGLRRNCLYFAGFSRNSIVPNLGEFSLTRLDIFRTPLNRPILNSPLWLLPRFAFHCQCHCCKSAPWMCIKKKRNFSAVVGRKRKFSTATAGGNNNYLLRSKTKVLGG